MARRGKDVPGALRMALHLKGVPSLSESESLQVKNADVLTSFTVKCLNRLRSHSVACTVENPHASLLWHLPTFQAYLQHPEVAYIRTSFCMFGTRWRKQIGILVIHFPLARALASDCTSQGGRCLFSNLPLQQLISSAALRHWSWERVVDPHRSAISETFVHKDTGVSDRSTFA